MSKMQTQIMTRSGADLSGFYHEAASYDFYIVLSYVVAGIVLFGLSAVIINQWRSLKKKCAFLGEAS